VNVNVKAKVVNVAVLHPQADTMDMDKEEAVFKR
jgi:hypothetical protein